MLNPTIVEGQIQGGVAHGIGTALFEEAVQLDGGEWVEIFGPNDEHYSWFNTGAHRRVLVDDVAAACAELRADGIEILMDAHGQGDYVWAHFRGADERIDGLTSGPYEKAPAS